MATDPGTAEDAPGVGRTTGCRIGVDVGGTFVDFVLERDGRVVGTHKELTTSHDLAVGVMRGLEALAVRDGSPLTSFLAATTTIVHGTTATTNALITLSGARTGLITTHGVRDALEMRRGIKERVHDLKYRAPEPLVRRAWRLGIHERLNQQGNVLEPLDQTGVREAALRLRDEGVTAVAICFMHAYANPAHEEAAAAEIASVWPEAHVVRSTTVLPQVRFYDRVSTTAISAFVGPLLASYLTTLSERLAGSGFAGHLLIVNSAAGVMSPEVAASNAATTIASGPASGPVVAVRFAASLGRADCAVVDMGGTSFDASVVIDGEPEVIHHGVVDRRAVGLPMVAVESIGAGGGSIARIDAGEVLRVGPASAGSEPGPACYGFGGTQPTVTDADLLLGYVDPARFLAGRLRLDLSAAERAMAEHLGRLGADPIRAAAGIYDVVNANMAAGLRRVTLERGMDVRTVPLVVAGGAGPVHAAAIAAELGIRSVIIPRSSSTFCALGALFLDFRQEFVRSALGSADATRSGAFASTFVALAEEGRAALRSQGLPDADIRLVHQADLRYERQLRELVVPVSRDAAVTGDLRPAIEAFHRRHEERYGYAALDLPVELVNLRVVAYGQLPAPQLPELPSATTAPVAALVGTRLAYHPGLMRMADYPVFDGDALAPGHLIEGPALVALDTTSIVVLPPYQLSVDRLGSFVLTHREAAARPEAVAA